MQNYILKQIAVILLCIVIGLTASAQESAVRIGKVDSTAYHSINWDNLDPRAIGFVKDYLEIHEERLEKMKNWGMPYFLLIENILKRYRLPATLKYLAVIESDLQSNALSSAGALGPWQLMPGTARDLGLTVTQSRDDRMDLNKSTHAAAKFLSQLYENLGDWLLVIAAYNGGPARVEQITKKRGSHDFWKIQNDLPAESRTHVKKFIATHYIFEKDGSETTGKKIPSNTIANQLTNEELSSSDTTTVYGKYSSMVICKNLEIDIVRFQRWNPDFDKQVAVIPFRMLLPKEKIKSFLSNRNQILRESVMVLMKENSVYDNEFPETSIPQPVEENKVVIKKRSSKKNQKSSSSSKPASSSK